jgi:hypothetical protein
VQDDWRISDRVTLNLGVRYTLWACSRTTSACPVPAGRPSQRLQKHPAASRLCLQGEWRRWCAAFRLCTVRSAPTSRYAGNARLVVINYANDLGRICRGPASGAADMTGPSGGSATRTTTRPDVSPRSQEFVAPPNCRLPRTFQVSIGSSISSARPWRRPTICSKGTHEGRRHDNINLKYDPRQAPISITNRPIVPIPIGASSR